MPMLKTRVPASFNPNFFYTLGRSLTMYLNDELAFIPKSGYITPAALSFYLMRCFIWYGYHAGIIDSMPVLNCSQYALPGWIALIFRGHAKVKSEGFQVSFQLADMTDAAIDALSVPEGIIFENEMTTPVLVTDDAEPTFTLGATVTGAGSEVWYDRISALIGSLPDTVTCDRIPKSGNGECYWTSNRSMMPSTPISLRAFRLMDPAVSVTFHGVKARDVNMLNSYTVIAKGVWTPSEHLAHRLKSNGISGSFEARYYNINLSWVSLVVADFIIAAGYNDPGTFWALWKTMYLQAIAYLFSDAPYFVRNSLNVAVGHISAGYRTNSHAKIKVPSSIMAMQRPGYYVEAGNPAFARPVGSTVNWQQFTGSLTFSLYTGTQGALGDVYFAGAVDLTAPWESTVAGSTNAVPINLIPEMQSYVDLAGFKLYSNPHPKVAKCLCFGRISDLGDTEVEAGVDIKYRVVEAVSCDSLMSPVTCCWMSAGVLIHHYDKNIAKHVMVFGNSGNVIRDLNEAAVLDATKATSVGQKTNVGDSYLKVTLDQFFGQASSVVETYAKSELKVIVNDYLNNLTSNLPLPTEDQVAAVLSGNVPMSGALPILGGAALWFGKRFWNKITDVRVRNDL